MMRDTLADIKHVKQKDILILTILTSCLRYAQKSESSICFTCTIVSWHSKFPLSCKQRALFSGIRPLLAGKIPPLSNSGGGLPEKLGGGVRHAS